MDKERKKTVIGFVGTTLDAGKQDARWNRWRPTVAMCQSSDLCIDRLELFVQPKWSWLAEIVRGDVEQVSPRTKVNLHELDFADPWDFEQVYGALHDWCAGYAFDPEREDYLVHMTTGSHVAQICLFLLTESRHLPAKLLQTAPPKGRDGEERPAYSIIDLDLSRYDRLARRFQKEQKQGLSFLKSGIETRNRAFNDLIEQIERVAIRSSAPLLLTGPTGSGKSQLARRIFELRTARNLIKGPFVEVNCATLRGDGAMSALFGHVKGSFTGAVNDRAGLLRSADGGVLFLDEIGELGIDEQAMLLRALEEKRFRPVGSEKEVRSDFQLIAGTNRDLAVWVTEGRFREDLLARINLWTFSLPALRDRREDIEPNIDYELDQYGQKFGSRVTFNRESREAFLKFATSTAAAWSGNFRDLNAAITRMATLAEGGRIAEAEVKVEVERLRTAWSAGRPQMANALSEVLSPSDLAEIDQFDRVQLEAVIEVCRASRTLAEAGRELFDVSRTKKSMSNDSDRLRKYLARFGLDFERVR
jgi:transcriptional regulatory protein RtcR